MPRGGETPRRVVLVPVARAARGAEHQAGRVGVMMDDRRHPVRQFPGRENPEHTRLVRQRARGLGPGLLEDERRPVARGDQEHAVAPRRFDHGQVPVDDRARLDKADQKEIVGDL